MESKEVIKFIEQQEKSIDFYKNLIGELNENIRLLKTMPDNWINPDTLELKKKEYTANEIITAFMKAKVYEGLKTNEFSTVLDTFIEFLENRKNPCT